MGINQRVALYHLHAILEGRGAQQLIVGNLGGLDKEVATNHAVHQYRNSAALACLADIFLQISIEGRVWVSMAIGLCLFIVMTELNDDVVAWLYLLQHLVPASFVDETF